MIQLYFLSILCNGLSGYLLFAGDENGPAEKPKFLGPTFYLVLGIMSAVVGVLKLLSPERIPILGDLLPAVAGVAAGFMLIFGIYRRELPSTAQSQGAMDRAGTSSLRFRKFIGLGLLAAALVHFLFPQALFL